MSSLIVIATDTRKAMCLQCASRHDFTIAGSDDDVFLCKDKYRSSCSMKAALRNPDATCPHHDKEWAVRWNLAATERDGGCGAGEDTVLTPEDRMRLNKSMLAARENSKQQRQAIRGTDAPVFKVYQ